MEVDETAAVEGFREKPRLDDWVSAGYFVFEPQVLDYLTPESVLEEEPLVCRIDTLDELEYFKSGGILQYVLRHLAA